MSEKPRNTLFGMKLKLLRVKRGLSQEDCCRKTHCTLRTWKRWESGETKPAHIYRKYIMELFPKMSII